MRLVCPTRRPLVAAAKIPKQMAHGISAISRRQLLVRGGGAVVAVGLGGAAATLLGREREDSSPGGGSWGPLIAGRDVAPVHVTLLASGQLLFSAFAADGYPDFLVDPGAEGSITAEDLNAPMRSEGDSLFCAGHAPLADGRILEVGGQRIAGELGLEYALLFDHRRAPDAGWEPIAADIIGGPSWYPTVTRLPDGQMLVISGFVDWGITHNRTIQLFDARRLDRGLSPWTLLVPHDRAVDISPFGSDYTHVFVLPRSLELDGRRRELAMIGATGEVHFFNYSERFADPADRFASRPNGRRPGPAGERFPAVGASSAMLADGRILVVGHGNEGAGGERALMTKADIYDPYSDRWASIETGIARSHPAAILLPDGSVAVVCGDGGAPGDPRRPQIIDPASGSVTTGPAWPDAGRRGYHNVALLVPDGRVLTGGGLPGDLAGRPGANQERTDLRHYSPPYLSAEGGRPEVTSAGRKMGYGRPYSLTFRGGPIHRVTLLGPGSMTHSIDMNQRCIVLFDGEADGEELTVSGPRDSHVAPPGDYLLFVLSRVGSEGGVPVPSTGRFVRVGAV
jgi:galactose oxidase